MHEKEAGFSALPAFAPERAWKFPRVPRGFSRLVRSPRASDAARHQAVEAWGGARLARAFAPILLATIFWVDTAAPAAIDVPALYVAPALLFIRTGRFWEPLLVAIVATGLTVVPGTPSLGSAG